MEKDYRTILYQNDEAVPNIVYITLNRPEKTNAISIGPHEMTGEVKDALSRANDDDQVKVVIFRGAGNNFCGGFDLSMVYRVYEGGPGKRPYLSTRFHVDEEHIVGMRSAIANCAKVTIAQIQGWCVEAGMYFASCSDIAIAAKNTKFCHRGQRLAFGGLLAIPLEAVMGHTKKIVELALTGRTISGVEAENIGIITKAVEPEELAHEVYALAKALCCLPSDAIAVGKMYRKHVYQELGLLNFHTQTVYHTLGTLIHYRPEERDFIFLRDREEMGEKEAFHRYHQRFEDALQETKYFRSYGGDPVKE